MSVVVVPPGFMSMSGGAYVINVRIAAKKENRKDAVIIRKCEKVKVKKENGKKRYFGFSSLSKTFLFFFPRRYALGWGNGGGGVRSIKTGG